MPRVDGDVGEVGIEAEDRAVAEVVFDDDVFSVVAVAGGLVGVGDDAGGDGADFIEGASAGIAFDRGDIDAFVEAGAENAFGGAAEGADEAVFSAGPGFADLTLEVPVDIHVELLRFLSKEGVVVGGELESEGLGLKRDK